MLRVSGFEFIVRLIPEAFIFMFAAYTFSKTKLDKKRYLLSSILLGISVFFVRMLPINYGVHTILNIIMLTIISYCINKIDMIESIKASIVTAMFLFILEGINMLTLTFLFKDKIERIIADVTLKTIFGLPSLICFGLIVFGYYRYLIVRNKFKYV